MIKKHHSSENISFREAFVFWLKLGFISFGGPAGQISIMHKECVEQRRWISEKRFLHALNYCMLLPGPEAQQLATYIGWLMHGTWGGIIAGVLFVLPSLFILIALSWLYIVFGNNSLLIGGLYGIKPAIVIIVLQAAHRIGRRTLKTPFLVGVAGVSFTLMAAFNMPFPIILLGAAIAGWAGGYFFPEGNSKDAQHKAHAKAHSESYGSAIIDDNSPVPEHARFSVVKLIKTGSIGLLLWAIPLSLLSYLYSWQGTLTQMGWFFTKSALLTFGGAYAVLPYVFQGAVEHYAWLTPTQMMDGLALGETTPGPLIMVVAYVGFIGGYLKALLGSHALFLSGALAASVVTWFTFLPSFVFILAGAPLVEASQHQPQLTAPLTAMTAAVVGVILNLALFFAYHTFWLKEGRLDVGALMMLGMAALAVFYFKRGVIAVLGLCAVAGIGIKMLGVV
ncbi:MAG: chromate efflux transporter [Pseudomonadota bacterium]